MKSSKLSLFTDEIGFLPKPLIYLLTLTFVSFPIFANLSDLPIQIWDESRNALNALNMYWNGNYIVTMYGGEPDLWNTKPPLLIWSQMMWMKILGPGELAIRLPSAISALLTCFLLLRMADKSFQKIWIGVIASFVLVTSYGYLRLHGARTGDFDAMLTLFLSLSLYMTLRFEATKHYKYVYGLGLSTALAMLTKGVAGGLFLPGIALYFLLIPDLRKTLLSKHFIFSILGSLALVLSYYFIREVYNPGYLNAVYENELGGRYLKTKEVEQLGFWYYWKNINSTLFKHYKIFFPIGLLIGVLHLNSLFRKRFWLLVIVGLSFFLIVSNSATKLPWYVIPIYPLLALFSGTFLVETISFIHRISKRIWITIIVSIIGLFVIFDGPFEETDWSVNPPILMYDMKWHYSMGTFFQEQMQVNQAKNIYVCSEEYLPHVYFYTDILSRKGWDIKFGDCSEVTEDYLVLVNQSSHIDELQNKYTIRLIKSDGITHLYRIIE